jgi:multidrug efflux system membrane fusion protein
VVPVQAIAASQKGPFVYVLKTDNTVESRPVVSPRTILGEAVIDQGLQPGETIVVDGQARLIPGAKVEITNGADAEGAQPSRAPKGQGPGSGDPAAPRTKQ